MFSRFSSVFQRSTSSRNVGALRAAAKFWRTVLVTLVLAFAVGLVTVSAADARLGGGGSFGSRGSRTFSMPSATPTAPRISPFQRPDTPNMGLGGSGFNRSPGLFGGGFGRGLVGGFLGAGLFGLLFGNGFMGGLGGGMSLVGLILQLGLLYLLFRFVMGLFASRRPSYGSAFSSLGGYGGGPASPVYGAGPQIRSAQVRSAPVTIGPNDYAVFERRLVDSQAAYSNGDIAALSRLSTPEMARNFEAELRANAQRGVVNRLSNVQLLQGDLSEAWSEDGLDYATVAMRFSLIDTTIETASGRVVAGDPAAPQQVTEVWTFCRPSGSGPQAWVLSGIQQA